MSDFRGPACEWCEEGEVMLPAGANPLSSHFCSACGIHECPRQHLRRLMAHAGDNLAEPNGKESFYKLLETYWL